MTHTAAQLDESARTVHQLIIEAAAHQVSREIAHMAEISVDAVEPQRASPKGFRTPAGGPVMTHVTARSRDIPEASVETRVSVWVTGPRAKVSALLITRAGSDQAMKVDVTDVRPEPTSHLHGQINDFVAMTIAHMVSSLNVAMQRTHIHEADDDGQPR